MLVRAETWRHAPKINFGYLSEYASMALSANTGGVLKWEP